ncbi:MAG: hypothetical protein GY759_23580 [Chloroflexi bacterium]|nr:hypothetical protein [Chloroflexota bacterium]
MERVRQAVGKDGLQIPVILMGQYGSTHGSTVIVEFEEESIRVIPVHSDRQSVENRALRYLFHEVGDRVSVEVFSLMDEEGWRVDVHGASASTALGTLFYDSTGKSLTEKSTSPADMGMVHYARNRSLQFWHHIPTGWNPWLKVQSALGWALSPSGARVPVNQALRGLRGFSDEFHSVRRTPKL